MWASAGLDGACPRATVADSTTESNEIARDVGFIFHLSIANRPERQHEMRPAPQARSCRSQLSRAPRRAPPQLPLSISLAPPPCDSARLHRVSEHPLSMRHRIEHHVDAERIAVDRKLVEVSRVFCFALP